MCIRNEGLHIKALGLCVDGISNCTYLTIYLAGLPTATTSWAVIPQNTSCLQEEAGFIPFLPKKIYLVSESELYVTGNTLLYRYVEIDYNL